MRESFKSICLHQHAHSAGWPLCCLGASQTPNRTTSSFDSCERRHSAPPFEWAECTPEELRQFVTGVATMFAEVTSSVSVQLRLIGQLRVMLYE